MKHKFIKTIPEIIESNVLYISTDYKTVIHIYPCGCGSEIVTPLSPTDWNFTFDGQTISLYPSVGNWSLPCQSHYWITNSKIEWAPKWSSKRIEQGRNEDIRNKKKYFRKQKRKSLFGFFFKK